MSEYEAIDRMEGIEFSYIMRPSEVFKQYLGIGMGVTPDDQFQYGMLAFGLEIVTVIKTLEALPTTTPAARAEVISVLHTLLQDLHLDGFAYEWYERLNVWRRPSFQVQSNDAQQHVLEPGRSDAVELLGPQLSPALASQLASRLHREQETLDIDALLDSGQMTEPRDPSDGLDELAEEGDVATLVE